MTRKIHCQATTTSTERELGNHHPRLRLRLRLAVVALVLIAASSTAIATPCDVDLTMDVSPRVPPDNSVVTYTIEYCDSTGDGAEVFSMFIGVSRNFFIPNSGVWTSCPRSTCNVEPPDGNMSFGDFTLAPNECVTFEYTLQLQPGLGGQQICLQGTSSLRSNSPPPSPFPCNKRTTDPATILVQDPTCLTVEDAAPGCDITASITPGLLQTCPGSGESLSCTGSQSGCPGMALSYEWTRNGVPVPGATGDTYPIPANEPPGGNQYRCLASCTALPACNGASIPAQVTILPSSASINVPESACIGQPVDVAITGAISCSIDCGDGTPAQPVCNRTCNYLNPGTYDIGVYSDDGNCQIDDVRQVEIFDQPVACIDGITSLCETDPAGPTVIALSNCSTSGVNYDWSTNVGTFDDSQLETPTLTLPDVSVPTSVTVTLEVVDPQGCGAPDQTQVTFDLVPAPTAVANADPLLVCIDEDVNFTADGSGAPGPFDFAWDFGDTNMSVAQNPTHAYTAAGLYDVSVSVTDSVDGCSDIENLQVEVEVCDLCPGVIPAVGQLLAIADVTDSDVEMSWVDLAEAQDGYNVWAVTTKREIPGARAPGGGGVRGVCTPSVTSDCLDLAVVPAGGDDLIYYQVRGICGAIEGE